MSPRPATHRPPALARRDALLAAAVEVVGERGVGGATHRAIAARAGVPLSTTSYFFGSLDELIVEALRSFVTASIDELDLLIHAVGDATLTPAQTVQLLVDALVAEPRASTIAQFEIYLEAARRPELQDEVKKILGRFEELARSALASVGARQPKAAARAFVAVADGFALQRLAAPRGRRDQVALRETLLDLLTIQLLPDAQHQRMRARLAGAGKGTARRRDHA
jgi:DNA-binding transcriptional regulator YbjK